jgi:nitroreductase
MTSTADLATGRDFPYTRLDAVHPLLAGRRSLRALDPAPLEDAETAALLEAARWAPSAMNAQPWRFLVGRVGDDGPDATHRALEAALAGGNRAWAHRAPLLIAAAVRTVEADGRARTYGPYELGLAVANLSLQAEALGLVTHQMGGFDAAAVAESLGVPDDYAVLVVLAVGRPGDPAQLPEWAQQRESAPRERLPLGEIAYADAWGSAARFDDGLTA